MRNPHLASTTSPGPPGGLHGADALARIGRTPLIEVEGIHVKLECANPGGSVKDRVAKFMLEEAAGRGELRPGDTVVEATSGNTGIALAWVSRQMGNRALIFMPEHMSIERRRMLCALGVRLELTPRSGGFELPIELRDAYRGQPGYYVPDQFGNPDNLRCHARTTGPEIVDGMRQLGCEDVDFFVAGVGTGGTLMGAGRALRAAFPGCRLVAVEPAESAVLSGGEPGEHGIEGIGDGFVPALVDLDQVDDVVRVTTEEAWRTAEQIRARHGHCVGTSSGANMAAALRLRTGGHSVVTLWPDCSDRYMSQGLQPPTSEEVDCPLKNDCAGRGATLLGT